MKTLFRLVIASITLSICLNIYSADNISKVTYKWVDEQGVTQYTERPPQSRAYEKITVNASGGKEITSVTEEEAITKTKVGGETKSDTLDEILKANERNCKIAKQNMEVLMKVAKIRVSDAEGENRILSTEEKQARIDETQKQLDIYCNSNNEK